MRVLMVWHSAVVSHYRHRLDALGSALGGGHVAVLVPRWWQEAFMRVEASHEAGIYYKTFVGSTVFTGNTSLYFFISRLRRAVAEFKPTLIHVREEPWSAVAAQVALVRRMWAPNAVILFETWQNLYKKYPFPFSRFEQWVFRDAAGAIAGSDACSGVLVRRGFKKPIHVIPLGVPACLLQNGASSKTCHSGGGLKVGYVGWLSWQKGVDILLKAVAKLGEGCTLIIVGTGWELRSLKALARDLGISERVQFLGAVPHQVALNLMGDFDCLVLPSRSTARLVEQFGRVLIEAMAQGVPVVGSTSGEIPNVIGDAGLVFPEGDSNALASLMDRLWKDPELGRDLAERGRKRVADRFTWEKITDETVAFYRQVLGRPR